MKTTVIISSKTRDLLKRIGTKGQTYDQIIADLLAFKTKSDQPGWSDLRGMYGLTFQDKPSTTHHVDATCKAAVLFELK